MKSNYPIFKDKNHVNFFTIGIRSVSEYELYQYYHSIQYFSSLTDKTVYYLCRCGMEAVKKKRNYNRQIEVDRVFFEAALAKSYSSVLQRVGDWREVYRHISSSKLPFRALFALELFNTGITPHEYKKFYKEIKNIWGFFSILNMEGPQLMMENFSDVFETFVKANAYALPARYPYALEGNPRIIQLNDSSNPLQLTE